MRIPIFIISLFLFTNVFCTLSRIDVAIKGLEDQKLIIAVQYGRKQIALDTIVLNNKGEGYFESNQKYPGGLYLIVFPDKKFYEFLIDNEQYFTIRSVYPQIIDSMSIEGAEMTNLYHLYQRKATHIQTKIESLINESKVSPKDSVFFLIQKINRLKAELTIYRKNIVENMPQSLIANIFQVINDPEDPDKPKEQIDKNAFTDRYNHLISNYFKNITFQDERLLRTSIFEEKIDFYFSKLIVQNKDTIIKSIDKLLIMPSINEQVFRFILNYLVSNYRNSTIEGSEGIFLHLVDNYYLAGKAPWADQRFIKILKAKADNLRISMVGSKAPDLFMKSTDNKNVSLYSIEAKYIILYFWSPDCEKCQKFTPEIDQIFKKYKSTGVKVFAVFTYADRAVWVNAIKDQNLNWIHVNDPLLKSNFSMLYQVKETPKIYILDKDKKIIAINPEMDQIEKFIK